jgi:1-acyl-sn-glycerol-3-phosphate acyltransferase
VLFYWFLKFIAIGPVVHAVFRPRAGGTEHVPDTGAAILASNHLSAADWIHMPLSLKRRVTFLAKAEYFTGTGPKGVAQRAFFSGAGQVPIDRSSASAAEDAIQTGLRILKEGKLLGIYPEGTRSPDGRLYRGKTGVARLALEAGAVVIPCAMVNTDVIQPTGRLLPKLRPRPGVRIGAPLDFSRYEGMSGDRFVERSMTDEIMYELMQLSGQEYVDQYAAKVKQAAGGDQGFGSKERAQAARELGDRLPGTKAS